METEQGGLNDRLRGGKRGALEKFGGGSLKLIRGKFSFSCIVV